MKKHHALFVFVVFSSVFFTACDASEDPAYVPSTKIKTQGIDNTLRCPAGQVAWNFGTQAPDTSTSLYQDQAGGDADIPVKSRPAIDIVSVMCNSVGSETEAGAAREKCGGKQSCSFTPTCAQGITVVWECGNGDRGPNNNGYSATITAQAVNRAMALTCSVPTNSPTTVTERKACIPEFCRGRTRRNLDLQCVPDTTKIPIDEEDVQVNNYRFREVYRARTDQNAVEYNGLGEADATIKSLYDNTMYEFTAKVIYGFAQEELPEEARLVMWFADEYIHKGSLESLHAFRCSAGTFDVGERNVTQEGADRVVNIKKRMVLSKDCTASSRLNQVKGEAIRKSGLPNGTAFDAEYDYVRTRIYFSFDLEGKTLFMPNGHTELSACVPNPPDFFFERRSNSFDMVSYYEQRLLHSVFTRDFTKFIFRNPTRIEIGPQSVAARKGMIDVQLYSPLPTTIPVDVEWYMGNDAWTNPFTLAGEATQGSFAGSAWHAQVNGPSVAPPNLRARVYLLPSDYDPSVAVSSDYPILGEIPLRTSIPTGKTVSSDLNISPSIKSMLFRSGSLLYFGDDASERSYELMVCLVADLPQYTLEPRTYLRGVTPRYEMEGYTWPGSTPRDPPPDFSLGLGNTEDAQEACTQEEIDDPNSGKDCSPYPNYAPGRGCRFTKTPLILRADRSIRPLVPVGSEPWPGVLSESASGSDTMSQTMDNDAQRRCTGNDCSTASQAGLRGEGEFGRQYFATNSTGDIENGEGFSGDASAEALGFQVLDPAEEGADADWPSTVDENTPPISITIAPPWDAIVGTLSAAAGGSPIEWDKGRYSGRMGLGVGFGFKIPIQMGPIPGMITITASVGVGIEINLEWRIAPDEDNSYPCIRSDPTEDDTADHITNCMAVIDTPMTQGDAHQACALKGGRLAEIRDQTEADRVSVVAGENATGSEINKFWIGGQLAYRYPSSQCATAYNASTCLSGSSTTWRWLSNDESFASSTAQQAATVSGLFQPQVSASSTLIAPIPNYAGIVYHANVNTYSTAVQSQLHRPICVFDPVVHDDFHQFTLGVGLGAGAGIGIGFCVPNDDIGFCIEGSMNLISVGITPQFSYAMHRLTNTENEHAVHSNINVQIPWQIVLLEGQVDALITAWSFFEARWTLVHFDGFRIAGGMLYNYDSPSMEAFQ